MLERLHEKPLDDNTTSALIKNVTAAVRARVPFATRVYIFGSAARKEMTDFSDVDVIVTVRNEEQLRLARKALAGVTLEVQWPLDLLVYTDADFDAKSKIGGVCFDALNEGELH